MPRKISRKGIIRKLDKLVSEIVIARDKACVTCGSKDKMGCGHLFTRQAYSTRWDLSNCFAQCWNCNYLHEYDPHPLTSYFIGKFGIDKYDELHRTFRAATPIKTWQLEILRRNLETILKDLKVPRRGGH